MSTGRLQKRKEPDGMITIAKDKVRNHMVGKYRLNDACRNSTAPMGTTICYYLCQTDEFARLHINSAEVSRPNSLQEMGNAIGWSVELDIGGSITTVIGTNDSDTVSVTGDANVDIASLLRAVEDDTYQTSDFSDEQIQALMETLNITRQDAVRTFNNMNTHPDICEEFSAVIMAGGKNPENPISVRGYTAEMLRNQCGLSLVGSYNYLAFLRDNPSAACVAINSAQEKRQMSA